MNVDFLHSLVSSAIWRAERLDELGLEAACSAWKEVSRLEEELARITPVNEAEGRIARRGAVRAALKAGNNVKAKELVELYTAERGAPKALRLDFGKMLEADEKGLSEQFPFAAKRYKPRDLQIFANQLHQDGPFCLTA